MMSLTISKSSNIYMSRSWKSVCSTVVNKRIFSAMNIPYHSCQADEQNALSFCKMAEVGLFSGNESSARGT